MASYTISPIWGAGAQLFDNSGNVLSGGKIYTYLAGTTTPAITYTTPVGNVQNSNPIVANSAGRLVNEIWLQTGVAYKFVLKDANDVLIATYDNIPSSPAAPITNDASSIAYEQGYQVSAGNFTVGATYLINFVGTTDFTAIGASINEVGQHFVATGVGSGTGTALYSRTVQTKLQEFVSVKDFGATGDGVTDDTSAIQECWDFCIANNRTAWVPVGTYRIGQTNISYGMSIIGEAGATFKLLDNQPKFTRMLTTENNVWDPLGTQTEDSPVLFISNLILDGNQSNQGPYSNYEKEQQQQIFLVGGGTTSTYNRRLRAIVENCTFKNGCSDGISVYLSVDLKVSDCYFWNMFRGSVVIIGANSVVNADNLSCGGDLWNSFFQAEVDGAVNSKYDVYITLTNSFFDHISNNPSSGTGLDLGYGGGSVVTVSNCVFNAGILTVYGWDATYGNATTLISNCFSRQIAASDFVRYGVLKFDSCVFLNTTANTSTWMLANRSFDATNFELTYNNCKFDSEYDAISQLTSLNIASVTVIDEGTFEIETTTAHGFVNPDNYGFQLVLLQGFDQTNYNKAYWIQSVTNTTKFRVPVTEYTASPTITGTGTVKVYDTSKTKTALYRNQASTGLTDETITVTNCYFSNQFLAAMSGFNGMGGTYKNISGNVFDCACFSTSLSAANSNVGRIAFGENQFGGYFGLFCALQGAYNSIYDFTQLKIPAYCSYFRLFVGISVTSSETIGKLTLTSNYLPYNTQQRQAFKKWEYNGWTIGYPNRYQNNGTVWSAEAAMVGKGVTGSRPTLNTIQQGAMYMDTTLDADGKPIWWNGTAWVDATGAVV